MGLFLKKIIHLDADCFYASVEMLKNPALRNVPLAVGGESNRRGVIATCNYIARGFGVRSAMASAQARKICPELVIIPPKFEDYKSYSRQIMDIYREFTDRIEPLSLDEAYLDVSDSTFFAGSATLIAKEIRRKVHEETGLCVSAGVAPLKFLAKIASDWRKPDGLFVINPDEVESFIAELPVKLLPGVGPVTADNLSRFGIYSVKDLNVYGEDWLIRKFGKFGTQLFRMASGQDEREVKTTRERKSISVETTFSRDITSKTELAAKLQDLILELKRRYEKLPSKDPVYKRFVKLKFNDFSRTSVESTMEKPVLWQENNSVDEEYCKEHDVRPSDMPATDKVWADGVQIGGAASAKSATENILPSNMAHVKKASESNVSSMQQPSVQDREHEIFLDASESTGIFMEDSELFNIDAYEKLLAEALTRSQKPVRLLGVGFRFIKTEDSWDQLAFKLD
ncbi:DNA polymerase IV [Thalassocella blandensis]|nr:DNA polymerase IV [Thalassocella blandensis]